MHSPWLTANKQYLIGPLISNVSVSRFQHPEELVALNAPKRLTEALRAGWLEGRAEMAHWYAMLLANVSTSKKGQERYGF